MQVFAIAIGCFIFGLVAGLLLVGMCQAAKSGSEPEEIRRES